MIFTGIVNFGKSRSCVHKPCARGCRAWLWARRARHPQEQQGTTCWSRSPARRGGERGFLFPTSQWPPLGPSPQGVLIPWASWKQRGRAESRSSPRPRPDLQSHPGTIHALFAALVLLSFKTLYHCRHDTNMLDLLPIMSKLRLFITTIIQWKRGKCQGSLWSTGTNSGAEQTPGEQQEPPPREGGTASAEQASEKTCFLQPQKHEQGAQEYFVTSRSNINIFFYFFV